MDARIEHCRCLLGASEEFSLFTIASSGPVAAAFPESILLVSFNTRFHASHLFILILL